MNKKLEFPGETQTDQKFPQETKVEALSAEAGSEPSHDVEYYVLEIGKRTLKTTKDVFDLADFYLKASTDLNISQLRLLMRQLRIKKDKGRSYGKAITCKYRAIAKDMRLREEPLCSLLPPNYSIIYEVSLLDDDQLQLGIDKGIIRPDVRKSEIEALRTKKFKRAKRTMLFSILQHTELSAPRKTALQNSFRDLVAHYPEIGMVSGDSDWNYRSSPPRRPEAWSGNVTS